MQLKQIEINQNEFKTHSEYKVGFDDNFSGSISHKVTRVMGHTQSREYTAEFQEGDRQLGSTYMFENIKSPFPKENTNTIAGEDLEGVIEHLKVIEENPKVKEGKHSPELGTLTMAVSYLIEFYEKEKRRYESTLPKDKGYHEVMEF